MKLFAILKGCTISLNISLNSNSIKDGNYILTIKTFNHGGKFVAVANNGSLAIFSELELKQITGKTTYDEALACFKDCLYTELEVDND